MIDYAFVFLAFQQKKHKNNVLFLLQKNYRCPKKKRLKNQCDRFKKKKNKGISKNVARFTSGLIDSDGHIYISSRERRVLIMSGVAK